MNLAYQLFWASMLAMSINQSGTLPENYKHSDAYRRAGFDGDVYAVSGGLDKIHAGLTGIIKNESKNALIIAFRGTDGAKDWLNDFNCTVVPYNGHGKVHKGFLESVQSVSGELIRRVQELLVQEPVASFYITGHSKGGAMAAIMPLELEKSAVKPVPEVIAFASPRVGDADFVKTYPVCHTRYESCRDLVPHVPFTEQDTAFLDGIGLGIVAKEAADAGSINQIFEILLALLKGDFKRYAPLGKLINIIPSEESPMWDRNAGETLHTFYNIVSNYALKGKSLDVFSYHTKDYEHYFT